MKQQVNADDAYALDGWCCDVRARVNTKSDIKKRIKKKTWNRAKHGQWPPISNTKSNLRVLGYMAVRSRQMANPRKFLTWSAQLQQKFLADWKDAMHHHISRLIVACYYTHTLKSTDGLVNKNERNDLPFFLRHCMAQETPSTIFMAAKQIGATKPKRIGILQDWNSKHYIPILQINSKYSGTQLTANTTRVAALSHLWPTIYNGQNIQKLWEDRKGHRQKGQNGKGKNPGSRFDQTHLQTLR